MHAIIELWDESPAVRLPRSMLEKLGLSEGDLVELTSSEESLIVQKARAKRHRTLEERMESFYGCPLEEIPHLASEAEVDWGAPVGKEIW